MTDPTVPPDSDPPVPPHHPPVPPHDPAGLDLARAVANSAGRGRRRRPRRATRPVDAQSSGAHPDERDPKRLGEALDRLVESKGWSTELSVHSLAGRWAALVGPELAEHSRPEAYRDQVLTVRATSTAWASQLRLLAPQLVAVLNEQLGHGSVVRVQILGPDGPSWKRGRLTVRDGRGPRDTYG